MLAEGYSAADLRHGPVAAVDADVPVLVFDGGPASSDLAELLGLLRRRNAPTALCAASPDADLSMPQLPEALAAIPAMVRAQQFALALTLVRGRNPDSPEGYQK